MRELSNLVLEAIEKQHDQQVELSFSIVYPDKMGIFAFKHIGNVSNREEDDSSKCLGDIDFHIGDFLDICIKQPGYQQQPRDNIRNDKVHGGRGRGSRGRHGGRGRI